jgi:hypothetical protein
MIAGDQMLIASERRARIIMAGYITARPEMMSVVSPGV